MIPLIPTHNETERPRIKVSNTSRANDHANGVYGCQNAAVQNKSPQNAGSRHVFYSTEMQTEGFRYESRSMLEVRLISPRLSSMFSLLLRSLGLRLKMRRGQDLSALIGSGRGDADGSVVPEARSSS